MSKLVKFLTVTAFSTLISQALSAQCPVGCPNCPQQGGGYYGQPRYLNQGNQGYYQDSYNQPYYQGGYEQRVRPSRQAYYRQQPAYGNYSYRTEYYQDAPHAGSYHSQNAGYYDQQGFGYSQGNVDNRNVYNQGTSYSQSYSYDRNNPNFNTNTNPPVQDDGSGNVDTSQPTTKR